MSVESPDEGVNDTPPRPGVRLAPKLGAWLFGARLALFWEQLWPALLPALTLAGVFLALALFDVLPLLPGWLHGLVLALIAGGLVTSNTPLRSCSGAPHAKAAVYGCVNHSLAC